MKNLYLTTILATIVIFAQAQWNTNTDENLLVSNLSSRNSVTVGTNTGKTYVAYLSKFENSYFMRAQLLAEDGTKLLSDTGVLVTSRKVNNGSLKYSFHASVDSSENLIVAYQYYQAGVQKIIVMKINKNGKNFWQDNHNGVIAGEGYNPTTAILPNQDIVVSWHNGTSISYQIIRAITGELYWPAPKTITPATNKYLQPQVFTYPDNTFGILFQENFYGGALTHLFTQLFDTLGNNIWTAPVQVSTGNTDSSNYYSIATEGKNLYVGYSNDSSKAYVQKITSDGNISWGSVGSAFAPALGNSHKRITLSSVINEPRRLAIWAVCDVTDSNDENSGIAIQKFNPEVGTRLLGEAAKMIIPMSPANNKHVPVVAICTASNPIFTYYNDMDSVYATSVDRDGNFAWTPSSVAIGTSGFSKSNFGFTNAVRKFGVAVWMENRDTADHLYAQNINCDGTTGVVLPISLAKFWGTSNNSTVQLFWETTSEVNNRGFHIERSADGRNFTEIAYVSSKASNGNSNETLSYSLGDLKPLNGDNYYRLKQEDLDGKFTYSNVILVKVQTIYSSRLNKVYPNPVKDVLNIYVESDKADDATILVSDLSGKILKRQSVSIINGSNNIQINLSNLASGNYFIQLISQNKYENSKQHFLKY